MWFLNLQAFSVYAAVVVSLVVILSLMYCLTVIHTETLIDGEPILKLPPKTIQLNKIDFTQKERAFYLTLEEGSRQKFKVP